MNCKDDVEEKFIKDWNEGKVRRVSDGKRMVPEREWQGLTDEEKEHYRKLGLVGVEIIETILKEKNT